MRVRCVSIVDANNEPIETSRSLTIGREYVVLGVSATIGHSIDVRITSDDGTHSLWPIDIFEVVEDSLSSSWVAKIDRQRLMLCPSSWSRPGFWEDYFNGEKEAVMQFDIERDRILKGE